jgi:hypothetical protein
MRPWQADLEEAFSDHDRDASGGLSLEEWQSPFEETVQNMLHAGGDEALDEVTPALARSLSLSLFMLYVCIRMYF